MGHDVIRMGDGIPNPLEHSPYTLTQTYGLKAPLPRPNGTFHPLRLYRTGRSPGRKELSSRGTADEGREILSLPTAVSE
ncbi:MAG: hypothetical protein CMA85_03625 [Euryarchaeota archaeon]|nr:hypothetical protein [Euryarchaeota archaeon]